MKTTQYYLLDEYLWGQRDHGTSYHALMRFSNCPWRRLSEMMGKGWTFKMWKVLRDGRNITMVRMLSRP